MFRKSLIDSHLSPEAQLILRHKRARWIPFRLIPVVARFIRGLLDKQTAPVRVGLQEELVASVDRFSIGGVDVVEITPRNLKVEVPGYIIYLHSGGYVFGRAQDSMSMLLADSMGMRVLSIEYDLAPEAVFPQALEQCVSAYARIIADCGSPCILSGTSSGGALALALLQRIAELNLEMPTAVHLSTPWAELLPSGDSSIFNEGRDPLIRWHGQLSRAAKAYRADYLELHPLISPLHGKYTSDFPPTIITTGTRDLFLSHNIRLYWKLRESGAQQVELRIWEGMWHAFEMEPDMPEAISCRHEVSSFLHAVLAAQTEE